MYRSKLDFRLIIPFFPYIISPHRRVVSKHRDNNVWGRTLIIFTAFLVAYNWFYIIMLP